MKWLRAWAPIFLAGALWAVLMLGLFVLMIRNFPKEVQ